MYAEPQTENGRWWVDRWLQLLDSYRFKKRLERARNYAREGNVLSLQFVGAELQAQVQGSDPQPYTVALHLDAFSDEDWHYVVMTLAAKALYSAQLLAGELPESIEQAFIQNGLNLFPFTLGEVHSQCSCPDKANPCKHIGAVYYQLADQFREDPFVIFRLRGRSREQLLTQLRQYRRLSPEQLEAIAANGLGIVGEDSLSAHISPTVAPAETEKPFETETPSESPNLVAPVVMGTDLADVISHFWQYDPSLPADLVVIAPVDNPLNNLERLGDPPLSYELAKEMNQALGQIYTTVSQAALVQTMG